MPLPPLSPVRLPSLDWRWREHLSSHLLFAQSDFDEENVTDPLNVFNQSEQKSPYIYMDPHTTQGSQGFALWSSSLAFHICIHSPLNLLQDYFSSNKVQSHLTWCNLSRYLMSCYPPTPGICASICFGLKNMPHPLTRHPVSLSPGLPKYTPTSNHT